MAKNNRDNFSAATNRAIRDRVSHRCSNPNCRVPTSGPSSNDSAINLGIAAHICAASEGGPRYSKLMTPTERKSIKNAIWLCIPCSTLIDRDPSQYSVELLNEWKLQAENKAFSEIGRKLPKDEDAINQVTAALTGLPKSYIAAAISNIHKATGHSLESLDPRFSIHTEYRNKATSIQIHPKEDVSLKFKITGGDSDKFHEQYCRLVAHGTELKISSRDITFEGSKLFEELFSNIDGIFSVSSNQISATQKLWFVDENTNDFEPIDDIHGNISIGTETFTFNGFVFNELLEIEYQINRETIAEKFNISFSLNFEKWNNNDITNLTYFNKIFSFFSKLSDGWKFYTALEVRGDKIFTSKGIRLDKWEYALHTYSHLNYIRCCRIIAKALHLEIKYTAEVTYSEDDHKKISAIAHTIENGDIYSNKAQMKKFETVLVLDETTSILEKLSEPSEPSNFKFWFDTKDEVEIFGTLIKLPPKEFKLESFIPKVHGQMKNLGNGRSVKITWIPQKNFRFSVNYILTTKDLE